MSRDFAKYDLWVAVTKKLNGGKIQPGRWSQLLKHYPPEEIEAALPCLLEYLAGERGTADHLERVIEAVKNGSLVAEVRVTEEEPEPITETASREPIPIASWGLTDDPIVAHMPDLIQGLVEQRLQGTEICVDYALAGAIVTVAACCGNRLRIRAWGDTIFPNLYVVLCGETGSSFKSAIPKQVNEIVSAVYPQAVAPNDFSVEALVTHLSEQPSALVIRDELSGLLAAMKGRDYMGPVRELLMTLYSHSGIYRRRLQRATYHANNPALSLLATIQPAVLGEELITGRNVESGFLNRIILVVGEGVPKWPRLVDPRGHRQGLVDRLRLVVGGGVVEVDMCDLEDRANIWRGHEDVFGDYGDAVARRASTHALKLASVLQAADEWPRQGCINPDWLELSLALLERWLKSAAAMVEAVHLKEAGERIRRDILKRVSRNGGATKPDLLRHLQIEKGQLERHLETLIEREQIVAGVDEKGREHYDAAH